MNLLLIYPTEIGINGEAELSGRRFDHLTKVLKVKKNDIVRVGVINGLIGEGVAVFLDSERVILKILLANEPPSPLPITLLLALPRPKAFRRILETVTTMGVKEIVLFNSYNVEKSYWSSPFIEPEIMKERMVLGLEQAQDTVVPKVTCFHHFNDFINEGLSVIKNDFERIVATPNCLTNFPENIKTPLAICIGPDRGLTTSEVAALQLKGFKPIALGKRILKVEQAVTAIIGRFSF